MPYWPAKVVVEEIEGTCPYFKKGDSFYTERSGIIPDPSTSESGLCMFAVARMSVFLNIMTRGMKQKDGFIECGSPGSEKGGCLDKGGIVRFRIIPGRKKDIVYASKIDWERDQENGTVKWKDADFQRRDPEETEVGHDWPSPRKS
jgi:uncharacterized repeat protein (TIGR04076 family)